MKGEISKIDQDGQASAPLQEVEFALILARMINTVKEDPVQMRFALYEFARGKLNEEISWADEKERKRLLAAFETAIIGVEEFSLRGDQKSRLNAPTPFSQAVVGRPGALRPEAPVALEELSIVRKDIRLPMKASVAPSRPTRALMSTWFRLAAGLFLVGVAVASAVYDQRGSLTNTGAKALSQTAAEPPKSAADTQPVVVASQSMATLGSQPSLPLPSVYGVFVLNNGVLNELDALSEQVPDKRVAMSTPVNKPSRVLLPDGRVKFVIFRRDLAANAPDRVDVRVVARVTRAMTFDAKGRGNFVPVSDSWNIRNTAHEFRVKPIPGNPEMLLMQPENPNFELPAGRYVLALKSQGYDFSVAGKITDASHCLERTEAANGTFYSECEK